MEDTHALDPNFVYFVSEEDFERGEVAEDLGFGMFRRPLGDVEQDWRIVMLQLGELVSQSDAVTPAYYDLDEVEVNLAFSASGRLGFLAEAGIEPAVRVRFKRRNTPRGLPGEPTIPPGAIPGE